MENPDDDIDAASLKESLELTKKIENFFNNKNPEERFVSLATELPNHMIAHAYLIQDQHWAFKVMEIATFRNPRLALAYADKIQNQRLRERVIANARDHLKDMKAPNEKRAFIDLMETDFRLFFSSIHLIEDQPWFDEVLNRAIKTEPLLCHHLSLLVGTESVRKKLLKKILS